MSLVTRANPGGQAGSRIEMAPEPTECFNPVAVVMRAEALSRKEGHVGANLVGVCPSSSVPTLIRRALPGPDSISRKCYRYSSCHLPKSAKDVRIVEFAYLEIASAAERYRPSMAKYLPKRLRTLYRSGRTRAINGFASSNSAINEIEGQCPERGDFCHRFPTPALTIILAIVLYLLPDENGSSWSKIAPRSPYRKSRRIRCLGNFL